MIKIGRVRVSLERKELCLDDIPQPLGSRAFAILELLIAAHGGLVTRDEILRFVWPNTVVEQNNIQVHVVALRRAFGSERNRIDTVPGRGYRILLSDDDVATDNNLPRAVVIRNDLSLGLLLNQGGLFGREKALEDIFDAMQDSPLVTLSGLGGIGKTQLGLLAARLFGQRKGLAVKVICLGSFLDSRCLLSAVATAIGARSTIGDTTPETLAQTLADQSLLLFLDNCEHLINSVATVCSDLLIHCPSLRVLATSREPMCIPGERLYCVDPLTTSGPLAQVDDILTSPAVLLFLSRMGYEPRGDGGDEVTLRSVSQICRWLGGIPLALEIAAARARALGIEEVSNELGERFLSVVGAHRNFPPRQRTLRSTFDWSYHLLTANEKRVFRILSVFSGEFTWTAIEAVASTEQLNYETVREAVFGLVSKSLLSSRRMGIEQRFYYLETIRAYARAKLEESQGSSEAFVRLARYFIAKYELIPETKQCTFYDRRLEELCTDLDSVRSVLDWCILEKSAIAEAVSLAAVTIPFLYDLSLVIECGERSSRVLKVMDAASFVDDRSRLALLAAYAASRAYTSGPLRDTRLAWARVLLIAIRLGDRDFVARALCSLWHCYQLKGESEKALRFAKRFSYAASRGMSETHRLIAQRALGTALHAFGDHIRAHTVLQEMIISYDHERHQWKNFGSRVDHSIAARATLARVFWLQGDAKLARETGYSALEAARETKHELLICYVLAESILPLNFFFREHNEARANAQLLEKVASTFNFLIWKLCAQCHAVYLDSLNCVSASQIARYRSIMTEMEKLGFGAHASFFSGQLALMLIRFGLAQQAANTVAAAVSRCEACMDLWYLPALRIIQGVIYKKMGKFVDAEAAFRVAAKLARRQGGYALELMAWSSLEYSCDSFEVRQYLISDSKVRTRMPPGDDNLLDSDV